MVFVRPAGVFTTPVPMPLPLHPFSMDHRAVVTNVPHPKRSSYSSMPGIWYHASMAAQNHHLPNRESHHPPTTGSRL
jgi:hypothetical protein